LFWKEKEARSHLRHCPFVGFKKEEKDDLERSDGSNKVVAELPEGSASKLDRLENPPVVGLSGGDKDFRSRNER